MSNATDIQDGIAALARARIPSRRLGELAPAAEIPAVGSTATSIPPKPTASSAGIASPLTENALNSRSYYADKTIASADGIFVVRLKPVATLQMKDANDAAVVLVFQNP